MRLIRAILAPVAASLALVGCGGGDGVDVNPVGSSTANEVGNSPTVAISGTPGAGVTVGTQYSFTPTASDSDGGAMTFSITNAPSWATFNASTGQLAGSPKDTDVGTSANIVISAADGKATASLTAFSITVSGTTGTSTPGTGTAVLAWTPPTENNNGTALTNLAGFHVYYGTSSASLSEMVQVSNATATGYTLTGLASGTWYFAVTSYTSDGTESERTTVSSKTI